MATSPVYEPVFESALQLSRRLNEMYTAIEKSRNVIIPTAVRSFTEALLTEALVFNRFDENVPERKRAVALTNVSSMLGSTEPRSHDGLYYITLIGVLQEVHSSWCKVFPFCE